MSTYILGYITIRWNSRVFNRIVPFEKIMEARSQITALIFYFSDGCKNESSVEFHI